MKIVVMTRDYPKGDDFVGDMFVHTRCKHYLKHDDLDLIAISNNTKENFQYEGVNVFSSDSFDKNFGNERFDLLVVHAPNSHIHKAFIDKYQNNFKKIVFIFHGAEALRIDKVYPKPYSFKKRSFLSYIKQRYCDYRKLRRLKKLFRPIIKKSHFIYVSHWMYCEFIKWVKTHLNKSQVSIIYNCVGNEFEKQMFRKEELKEYDFISIRSTLSGSKYCVDIICELAKKYPQYKFCLIGQGDYFNYCKKPNNVDVFYKLLTHQEVIDFCNRAKSALMPTKTDSQGVMACEIATLGMPLITSDIKVMREVFAGFENVYLVENDVSKIDLEKVFNKAVSKQCPKKNEKYFEKNTSGREIELFRKLVE